jgi:hypothetical protein
MTVLFNCGIIAFRSLGLQILICYVVELLVVPWLKVENRNCKLLVTLAIGVIKKPALN